MKETACLFDLDGVVLNTEHQYSKFWGEICREYLGDWQICLKIKGNTLGFIMDNFFGGIKDKHDEILAKLKSFEEEMSLEYIPGAREFLEEFGVEVKVGEFIASAEFEHNGKIRQLHAYRVFVPHDGIKEKYVLAEHTEYKWVEFSEIENLEFVDSDLLIYPMVKEYAEKQENS